MAKRAAAAAVAPTDTTPPPLVPQPHGGALYAGGMPGNKGGGRPPSEVRAAMLAAGSERIPRLAAIADGVVPLTGVCAVCGHREEGTLTIAADPAEMIRSIDVMLKYGLGEKSEIAADVVQHNLDRTLTLAETLMPEADYKTFCHHMMQVWNG